MEEIKCPYCEEYINIDTTEQNEGISEYECPKCEKHFEVYAELKFSYKVMGKADCLNGAEHNWVKDFGVPELHFRGKYHCKDCSATKTVKEELATKEEWLEYNKK